MTSEKNLRGERLDMLDLKGIRLTFVSFKWGSRELFKEFFLLGPRWIYVPLFIGREPHFEVDIPEAAERKGLDSFFFVSPLVYRNFGLNINSQQRSSIAAYTLKKLFCSIEWDAGMHGIFGLDFSILLGRKAFVKLGWSIHQKLKKHFRDYLLEGSVFSPGVSVDLSEIFSNRVSLGALVNLLFVLSQREEELFVETQILRKLRFEESNKPLLISKLGFLGSLESYSFKELVRVCSLVEVFRARGDLNKLMESSLVRFVFCRANVIELLNSISPFTFARRDNTFKELIFYYLDALEPSRKAEFISLLKEDSALPFLKEVLGEKMGAYFNYAAMRGPDSLSPFWVSYKRKLLYRKLRCIFIKKYGKDPLKIR